MPLVRVPRPSARAMPVPSKAPDIASARALGTAFERPLARAEDTAAFGARLAARLRAGDAVLLEGPLGAGKSHLARAAIRALTRPEEEVPSPSYTLVQTYEARDGTPVWHADLHRLSGPDEVWELGLLDALPEAIAFVEWPDRMGPHAPPGALWLRLAPEGEGRRLLARGEGPRWAGLEALLDG